MCVVLYSYLPIIVDDCEHVCRFLLLPCYICKVFDYASFFLGDGCCCHRFSMLCVVVGVTHMSIFLVDILTFISFHKVTK